MGQLNVRKCEIFTNSAGWRTKLINHDYHLAATRCNKREQTSFANTDIREYKDSTSKAPENSGWSNFLTLCSRQCLAPKIICMQKWNPIDNELGKKEWKKKRGGWKRSEGDNHDWTLVCAVSQRREGIFFLRGSEENYGVRWRCSADGGRSFVDTSCVRLKLLW